MSNFMHAPNRDTGVLLNQQFKALDMPPLVNDKVIVI